MLTAVQHLRVTPRLRYLVALARRATQLADLHGGDSVYDLQLVNLANAVLHQISRQEAAHPRMATLARLRKRPVMAAVVDVQRRRRRRA